MMPPMVVSPFVSDRWFVRAREVTSGLPEQRGVSFRLEVRTGESGCWHQVVEGGRVVAWGRGSSGSPDLVLRWSVPDAVAAFAGSVSGTEALAALRVIDDRDGVQVETEPSPLDIAATDELARLPLIPDATLVVQYVFTEGPFGLVEHWWGFEDGRSAGMGLGVHPDPDVRVRITFASMVGVRRGELSILEALERGGDVEGGEGPLMLLAGLQESPELHAAELACGPSGPVLAAMGRLWAAPGYAEAVRSLVG